MQLLSKVKWFTEKRELTSLVGWVVNRLKQIKDKFLTKSYNAS